MILLLMLSLAISAVVGQEATGEEMQENEGEVPPHPELNEEKLGDGRTKCPPEAFNNLCINGTYKRLRAPTGLKEGGTVVNVSMTVLLVLSLLLPWHGWIRE
jgi:hypothetical protein